MSWFFAKAAPCRSNGSGRGFVRTSPRPGRGLADGGEAVPLRQDFAGLVLIERALRDHPRQPRPRRGEVLAAQVGEREVPRGGPPELGVAELPDPLQVALGLAGVAQGEAGEA